MPKDKHSIRAIAHFDLDAFFVSVERKRNPDLNNCPLIVGGKSDRGVVAACSYETRKFGVHSAMPMVTALRLCPEAIVVPPQRKYYVHYSRLITELISKHTPLFEKASIDEFYIDFTGMGDFLSCYERATNLRLEIMAETSLPISFALSANKLVSKIAVDTIKPNGQIKVEPGTEKEFLANMPVEKIPMVGKETAGRLHKMGIFTIAQLSESSKDTLRTFLGKHGQTLVDRANGIDDTPVSDQRIQKSISTETTFDHDISNRDILEKELLQLNTETIGLLRKTQKVCCCVAIKVRFHDFETMNRQMTIPPTASEDTLRNYVKELFRKYYDGKKSIRLLGVRYSNFIQEGFQLDLFENAPRQHKLHKTLDELRAKFGVSSILRAGEL